MLKKKIRRIQFYALAYVSYSQPAELGNHTFLGLPPDLLTEQMWDAAPDVASAQSTGNAEAAGGWGGETMLWETEF